jgi:hypothetical protein
MDEIAIPLGHCKFAHFRRFPMLKRCFLVAGCLIGFAASAFGQQAEPKALTNADVIAMYKGGLDSPTIISAIQSQDTNFDISATGLLQMKKSAIPPKLLDAVIAAAGKKKVAAENAAVAAAKPPAETEAKATEAPAPASLSPAKIGQPSVFMMLDGKKQLLPVTQTQVVQAKTKTSSLTALSTDGSLSQALNGVTQSVSAAGSMKGSSKVANMALMANPMLGGALMAGSMFAHRKQSVTEVWAIPGPKSETVIHVTQPSFEVHCDNIPGIDPDAFQPVLLRLEPTPNNFRLVGATEAKTDSMQDSAADWSLYSSFVEDLGPAHSTKLAPGSYQLQVSSALPPGEYAVALRPISKDKKFSGMSISQNKGDGLIFNSVWSFEVAQ